MQRTEIPDHLVCPISAQIYLEPITITPSGYTFEKDELDKHIAIAKSKGQKPLCPVTRKPIESSAVNWGIKTAVEVFLADHPEMIETEQYKKAAPAPMPSASSPVVEDISAEVVQQISADEALARRLQSEPEVASPAPQPSRDQARIEADQRSFEQERARNFQRWQQRQIREAQQIQEEAHARERELQRQRERETKREQERKKAERASRLVAMAREQSAEIKAKYQQEGHVELNPLDEKNRQDLLTDLQNLIFALKFEKGPQPRGSIQNDSLLFFAILEQAFLEPLPWQKIKVEEGPKPQAMYEVLKAAKRALNEVNLAVLTEAKQTHAKQYDLVKPVLGSAVSLNNDGYAKFARAMGTVKNQPGYLVDQIILRVDRLLADLSHKYTSAAAQEQPRM